MTTAPILLFTYKRLETLKLTIEALKRNGLAIHSDLFIFSDAAKNNEDEVIIGEVRCYIKQISGFKSITITEAKTNKGLANSIIRGVTEVMNKYEQAIVLEDDLITTPNFLFFMNACLNKYQHEEKVFSVSGYSFNLGADPFTTDDAYFLSRGWSWGWATWKNRWEEIDWEVKSYNDFVNNRKAKRAFAQGGSDLNKMLEKQMNGKLDSWAIRWFYHQFQIGGLTVYPVLSKVYNAGFDQHATHTKGSDKRYLPAMDTNGKESFRLPNSIQLSSYYHKQFRKKMHLVSRFISKIDTYLKYFSK